MKKFLRLLTTALFVSSLNAGLAAAIDIPPGADLFETPPTHTQLDSLPTPLPADFFGPGSDPFDQPIALRGKSLDQQGSSLGRTSTVVHRLAIATFPDGVFPSQSQVPIEIVALNLVSVQPITVTYGGVNPELWNVSVNLSSLVPQSQGMMTITREYENGGVFEAYLPVTTKITFTRREDGEERVLDPMPEEWMETPILPPFPDPAQSCWSHAVDFRIVTSDGTTGVDHDGDPSTPLVPVLPSTNFVAGGCGFTPPGQRPGPPDPVAYQGKVLDPETAAWAKHGVQPTNPPDHYKVYDVNPVTVFHPVSLQDQFDSLTTKFSTLVRIDYFANPVNKNNEGAGDPNSHLVWYRMSPPGAPIIRDVTFDNQFGTQNVRIGAPEYVLLPAEKVEIGSEFPQFTDHYECYRVIQGTPVNVSVTLWDQFESDAVQVEEPVWFCNPVDKNEEGLISEINHLVFYKITPQTDVLRTIYVETQFDTLTLDADSSRWLGVPSEKRNWDIATAVRDDGHPVTFALYQNVPNPFNPTTTIRYEVPYDRVHVTLKIYDVHGGLVRTLVDDVHSAGIKEAFWDARNAQGREVASGIYFYRLTAAGYDQTRKMVLLR